MNDIYDKFFQLLRLTIGSSTDIPLIQKEEWKSIYEIAQKQSLMGVIFDGIQKMSMQLNQQVIRWRWILTY